MTDLAERIRSFAKLEPNWDSYGASTIEPMVIERALAFVDRFTEPGWDVVPTSDGGIQFENAHTELELRATGRWLLSSEGHWDVNLFRALDAVQALP